MELEQLQAEWPQLVTEIGEEHTWLRTDLLDSWPMGISDTTCILGFDPEFAGEIEEVKTRGYRILHDAVVGHIGRKVNIECCISKEPIRWSHELKHPLQPGEIPSGNVRAWEAHPAIKQILEVFHGDVRDVQH